MPESVMAGRRPSPPRAVRPPSSSYAAGIRILALSAVALVAALLLPTRQQAAATFRPAPVPLQSQTKPSPFGVNAHIPSAGDFAAMSQAGFGWARIDLTWDRIEPVRGEFDWATVDRVVEEAQASGINLLGILGYCPRWAASGPDAYYPPRDTALWKAYVTAMVTRYRGRIRYWSLWNEPNSHTFFRGSVEQYIHGVLIPGARAAKAADPDCRIVGPELAHLNGAHWDTWLDRILAEAGSSIDVIAMHCYEDDPAEVFRALDGRRRPWEKPSVMRIIRERGQAGKPFWLTETGWRSNEIGEAKQARYVLDLFRGVAGRPFIRKVFLFELKDSKSLPGYGLLRLDGTQKPAYVEITRFIRSQAIPERIPRPPRPR